jgi:Fe/S biogenesis protein NfuA
MTDVLDTVLQLTDHAHQVVLEARAGEEGKADELGLFIEVTGVAGASFTYDMYFQPIAEAGPDDVVEHHDGVAVIVAGPSVDRLRGATLGVDADGSLAIANPNSPSPAVAAAATGALAPSPNPSAAPPPPPPPERPLLTITQAAREIVVNARAEEPDPDKLALWLEVSGEAGGQFTYDMYFQALDDVGPDDAVEEGEIPVVVPSGSVARVRGSTLDISATGAGMVVINPNSPHAAAPTHPDADLSGEVPQKIIRILEEQINPSIAAHGGRAELVAVEADTAYLRLGGGCQGCGLAKVTLSEGISVAIQREVPEIVNVVDVTDHASGENPFYEPSKK